jgi:hypothetical protein
MDAAAARLRFMQEAWAVPLFGLHLVRAVVDGGAAMLGIGGDGVHILAEDTVSPRTPCPALGLTRARAQYRHQRSIPLAAIGNAVPGPDAVELVARPAADAPLLRLQFETPSAAALAVDLIVGYAALSGEVCLAHMSRPRWWC